jgi:hypothetical protein
MKATIEGNELVIRIELEVPHASGSGKTLIVATTGGFAKTTAICPQTKLPISVSVNAFVPNK